MRQRHGHIPPGRRYLVFCLPIFAVLKCGHGAPLASYGSLEELPGEEASPQHLRSHMLLLPADGTCETQAAKSVAEFFAAAPHARVHRELALASGSLAEELGLDRCGKAVCLEKGTPLHLTKHWHHRFDDEKGSSGGSGSSGDAHPPPGGFNFRRFQDWYLRTCQTAEIGFVSYHPHRLQVFWVDESNGRRVEQGALARGERHTAWRSTHLGHKFALVDAETGDDVVGWIPVVVVR